jgi:hypothetical protein
MNAFWSCADGVLRGGLRHLPSRSTRREWQQLVLLSAIFGALYGAAMGTYALSLQRAPQVLLSAFKVPLWMLVTGGLSLPLFGVLYTLWGLQEDFRVVLRALLITQACFAMLLSALAPLTLFCYASLPLTTASYSGAVLFNVLIFGVASIGAQYRLKRQMKTLIENDWRHQKLLRAWLFIFSFIGVQMAWILRPFIGDPEGGVTFFREGAMGNAYIALWNIVLRGISG